MKTLGEVLQLSVQYLKEKGVDRPRRSVEEILSYHLKLERLELYMHFEKPLEEKELNILRGYLKRRAQGEPLQYIFKEMSFYHCSLEVGPDVLIPRQETEILLSKICERIKDMDLNEKVAWDVCCGSGCLGIGLKKAFPMLQVFLSDLSEKALDVAKRNAERNQTPLFCLQGDLLDPFGGNKADLIICNPPYVTEQEYLQLEKDVKDYEPKLALVSGHSGLEFYDRLSKQLPKVLNPGGKVFFEIGTGQGEGVLGLFNDPCWKVKQIERDFAGHDRFFFLEIE